MGAQLWKPRFARPARCIYDNPHFPQRNAAQTWLQTIVCVVVCECVFAQIMQPRNPPNLIYGIITAVLYDCSTPDRRQSRLSSTKRRADAAADNCLHRCLRARLRLRANSATPKPSEYKLDILILYYTAFY